ncbi:hypothetical protein LB506_000480 [Fusarium annulatum]|nr:hypothetical protein LB506_000480 [Fusarium annulatum]
MGQLQFYTSYCTIDCNSIAESIAGHFVTPGEKYFQFTLSHRDQTIECDNDHLIKQMLPSKPGISGSLWSRSRAFAC